MTYSSGLRQTSTTHSQRLSCVLPLFFCPFLPRTTGSDCSVHSKLWRKSAKWNRTNPKNRYITLSSVTDNTLSVAVAATYLILQNVTGKMSASFISKATVHKENASLCWCAWRNLYMLTRIRFMTEGRAVSLKKTMDCCIVQRLCCWNRCRFRSVCSCLRKW